MLEPALSQKFTFHARHSLSESESIAAFCRASVIKPTHLLLAIHKEKGSLGGILLKNMGFSDQTLLSICRKKSRAQNKKPASDDLHPEAPIFSEALKTVLVRACAIAHQFAYPYVGSEHLVYALLESTDKDMRKLVNSLESRDKERLVARPIVSGMSNLSSLSKLLDLPGVGFPSPNAGPTDSETPYLDQFGIDLTDTIDQYADIITGRSVEIERMLHILGRRTKNNPLLIGEPGVGKTAIVNALAKGMFEGDAGLRFLDKRIIAIDLALIVAGTSFRGEFETRLKEILFEAAENPDIILFIDEIHTIIGAGNASGALDAANILKPALSRGDIQVIGATTFAEYKRHIEKDPAFERRFQPVIIAEPTPEEAKRMLSEGRCRYEAFHRVIIAPEAVEAAVEYSVRFITDRFLPDKAFDLIDESAAGVRQKHPVPKDVATLRALDTAREEKMREKERLIRADKLEEALTIRNEERLLTKKIARIEDRLEKTDQPKALRIEALDIAKTVAKITRVPIEKITAQNTETPVDLEPILAERIIGQSEAVRVIASTLLRSMSGVSHPDRPLGSFLFLGPSGTGKTLSAKVLTETLFHDKNAMIRLDMSEFAERHSIAQIIGAPAGYVGFGEGGKLTEKVRRKPYSVILFDEIEKAHPDVFNILLQILDEGILTDAEGRSVSFRNTVIILTSNIGTQAFTQSARIGFHNDRSKSNNAGPSSPSLDFETVKKDVLKDLKNHLRLELINRLDHIVVFAPLSAEHLRSIVGVELRELSVRLAKRSVVLRFDGSVIEHIARKSCAVESGARLIRRTIQDDIETIVAKHLAGQRVSNRKTVNLTVTDDAVVVAPSIE
jgi:ATP-dependent Clp protease ATP-binding subunit ClpC